MRSVIIMQEAQDCRNSVIRHTGTTQSQSKKEKKTVINITSEYSSIDS